MTQPMTQQFAMRLCCAGALTVCAGMSHAIGVTDARGDYVAGFTGSKAGDLDVIGSFVTYNVATNMFVFSGTMDADIGATPGGFYVWGVNRGAGTAGFAANGVGGVLFDSIVRLNQDGSGTVIRFSGPDAGATPLAAGTAKIIGSTIIGQVNGSLLTGNGFAKPAYTWNLWPRDPTLTAFAAISDFAPDNSNLGVTVIGSVPEPTSLAMFALGLGALALGKRRLSFTKRT